MCPDHFGHKRFNVTLQVIWFPLDSLVLQTEPCCGCNKVSAGSCRNDASDMSAWIQPRKGMIYINGDGQGTEGALKDVSIVMMEDISQRMVGTKAADLLLTPAGY